MQFSGGDVKELQSQHKKLVNKTRSEIMRGIYKPYSETLEKTILESIVLVSEIREEYFERIRDAPVNLKYLTSDDEWILDWKRLKSTKYKMGILNLTERDLNNFMNKRDRPSKNMQYLMQLDYEKKEKLER
jgi:hypothetical protein